MLVHVTADTLIAILIGGNGNVLLGRDVGFADGTEFRVDDEGAGTSRSVGDELFADWAVIGTFGVLVEPKLGIGKRIFAALGIETEFLRFAGEFFGFAIDSGLFGAGKSSSRFHEDVAIVLLGKHDEPVTADRFRGWSHEHWGFAGTDEVPAVIEGLAAFVVEFEDLVKRLEGKWFFVVFGASPFFWNVVIEVAGADFLGSGTQFVLAAFCLAAICCSYFSFAFFSASGFI